jgi:hypothetical protein
MNVAVNCEGDPPERDEPLSTCQLVRRHDVEMTNMALAKVLDPALHMRSITLQDRTDMSERDHLRLGQSISKLLCAFGPSGAAARGDDLAKAAIAY